MAPALRVVGEDVLFAHWPVPVAQLTAIVPDSLAIDTYDGTGWVSVLAHEVTGAQLTGVPISLLPTFGEVEFRTYVTHEGEPGVHFFSCDTSQEPTSTISNRLSALPFYPASISVRRHDGEITLRSRRNTDSQARFDVRYTPTGATDTAAPDSLAAFLIERHTYFAVDDGELLIGTVERDPWELSSVDASIKTNTLFEATNLEPPADDPVFHYSPRFESTLVDQERRPQ